MVAVRFCGGKLRESGAGWRPGLWLLCSMFWLAVPVAAHDASSPIAGDSIAIDTGGASSGWSFHFDVSGESGIGLGHDPSTDGFSLLVRGTGDAGGNDAGRTSRIELDPNFWSPTTSPAGFAYNDASGSRGGITAATLVSGAVSIDAAGAHWEWDIGGDQEAVWVQFWIEEESFCSNFSSVTGASLDKNRSNHFEATGASAPGACPSPASAAKRSRRRRPRPGATTRDGPGARRAASRGAAWAGQERFNVAST